jgi:hypothetical protein
MARGEGGGGHVMYTSQSHEDMAGRRDTDTHTADTHTARYRDNLVIFLRRLVIDSSRAAQDSFFYMYTRVIRQ